MRFTSTDLVEFLRHIFYRKDISVVLFCLNAQPGIVSYEFFSFSIESRRLIFLSFYITGMAWPYANFSSIRNWQVVVHLRIFHLNVLDQFIWLGLFDEEKEGRFCYQFKGESKGFYIIVIVSSHIYGRYPFRCEVNIMNFSFSQFMRADITDCRLLTSLNLLLSCSSAFLA